MHSVNYSKLPETEREKVKNILFILDSFGVSDEAYYELFILNGNMTKAYIIKQCRSKLNKSCSISRTPGNTTGAQLNFRETLDMLLGEFITVRNDDSIVTNRIKIAVDGAKVSRLSNFLVMSLALLNCGEAVMSHHGQHELAIVSAAEKFIPIKKSFSDIFSDINNLLSQGSNGTILYTTAKILSTT